TLQKPADCFRSPEHGGQICFARRITISSEQSIAPPRTKMRVFRSWQVQACGCNVRVTSAPRDLALKARRAATSRRFKMTRLRKAAIGAVAALALGAGVTATATPSMAQGWHGHSWHGDGWRGGGRGGYWRGGRGYGWGGG